MILDSLGYERFGGLGENLLTQMTSTSPLYTIEICIYPIQGEQWEGDREKKPTRQRHRSSHQLKDVHQRLRG